MYDAYHNIADKRKRVFSFMPTFFTDREILTGMKIFKQAKWIILLQGVEVYQRR